MKGRPLVLNDVVLENCQQRRSILRLEQMLQFGLWHLYKGVIYRSEDRIRPRFLQSFFEALE